MAFIYCQIFTKSDNHPKIVLGIHNDLSKKILNGASIVTGNFPTLVIQVNFRARVIFLLTDDINIIIIITEETKNGKMKGVAKTQE